MNKKDIEEQVKQDIKNVYKENSKLKIKINKAIEHINNAVFTIDEYEKRELLNILKGEEDE